MHPGVEKKVTVFLNRLLAMSMDDQQLIFKYFSDTMEAMIAAAKSTGNYEAGPIQLKATAVSLGMRTFLPLANPTVRGSCPSPSPFCATFCVRIPFLPTLPSAAFVPLPSQSHAVPSLYMRFSRFADAVEVPHCGISWHICACVLADVVACDMRASR